MPPKGTQGTSQGPNAPQNSGYISIDQRSEISERSRPFQTERETPARSYYTSRHLRSARRGPATQSPGRMQVEFQSELVSHAEHTQQHQSVYWGTDVDERAIEQNFTRFILEFTTHEGLFYMMQLNQLVEIDQSILKVDGKHLYEYNITLYNQLIRYPAEIIPIFDRVAQKIYFEKFKLPLCQTVDEREEAEQQAMKVIVGIINLVKIDRVRDLNPNDINHLVQVKGIVIRCSDIYPEMKQAYFTCVQCGNSVTAQLERGRVEEPTICDKCKGKHTFEIIHNLCQFTDKQYIKLQEPPENVPEGETPQTVSLMAYDDNVDEVKPGDRITVTGVYRAQSIRQTRGQRVQKSVYNTYLDVISYQKVKTRQEENDEYDENNEQVFSEEARVKFYQLASDPNIYHKLVYSLAPSIWEQDDVKKGILCQLFGGQVKDFSQSPKGQFRSDINILLVGDPSTSKSQILSYVHGLSQRGIYTSGKGSSAVGLTVYVTRDPETREIVLESGALVLSDLGICCIDEFDKMDSNAQTILHEAMEQQTISVAKAGIVSQLNARTAVLAAANPVKSRYDPKKSVVENINLPPTILSRFDLIYLMLDEQHAEKDKLLAYHILDLYATNKEGQLRQIKAESDLHIDRETLSQYIAYARNKIKPKITQEAEKELVSAYVEMRRQGISRNTITATPRQLESLIRLSEALAKMELKDRVTAEHVQEAVRLMQVATKRAAMDPITGLIDMDVLATGRTQASRVLINKYVNVIRDTVRANSEQFRGNGFKFYDLLNQINSQILANEMRDEQEDKKKGSQDTHENEFREALKLLEEEQFVILAGDRNRPRVRAGHRAIV